MSLNKQQQLDYRDIVAKIDKMVMLLMFHVKHCSLFDRFIYSVWCLLVPVIEERCTLLDKDSHDHEHLGKGRQ